MDEGKEEGDHRRKDLIQNSNHKLKEYSSRLSLSWLDICPDWR